MRYHEFSKHMYNNILSFYLELVKTDEIMSAPEIADELEIAPVTVRKFIGTIETLVGIEGNKQGREIYAKLYESILLHTKLQPGSRRFIQQQEIIKKQEKRKQIEQLVKKKIREYNKK